MSCIFFEKINTKLKTNRSGLVIIVVLWIVVILSVLATSIGRQNRLEISLTKHALDKVRSKYYAASGVHYALELIRQDSDSEGSKAFDTQRFCGLPSELNGTLEEIFRRKTIGEGYFEITFKDFNNQETRWGLLDEERKININAIRSRDVDMIAALLSIFNVDQDLANEIGFAMTDWADENNVPSHPDFGAEEEFYASQETAYYPKNKPFDAIEELRYLRGMTEEIFTEIKPYLTIYPKQGALKINIDTADETVLKALAYSFTGQRTNTDRSDGDSLVEKIIQYRVGEDGVPQTDDDRPVEPQELGLNAKENVIFMSMRRYQTQISNYFHVRSVGYTDDHKVRTTIEAVIAREQLSIVSWNVN
ncbi:MAG: general secretion pathway protein GspK [Candidatus Omnitrophica bacterium]|nr:general secretion pathway protein GspK [Candidatus Omnitrophota bacterium]